MNAQPLVADGLNIAFRWTGKPFEPVPVLDAQALSVLPPRPTLDQILAFERLLQSYPAEQQTDVGVQHHFAPDVYMRDALIPARTFATGMQHRTEHFSILLAGTITVWTEEGMRTLSAPAIIRSLPGAKRVGYAHTDVRWLTVHATDETDVDKLVEKLTFPADYLLPGGTA